MALLSLMRKSLHSEWWGGQGGARQAARHDDCSGTVLAICCLYRLLRHLHCPGPVDLSTETAPLLPGPHR